MAYSFLVYLIIESSHLCTIVIHYSGKTLPVCAFKEKHKIKYNKIDNYASLHSPVDM